MTIKDWLAGDLDYNTGVKIYGQQRNKNAMLYKRFSKNQTPGLKSQLKYELTKLAKTKANSLVKKPIPAISIPRVKKKPPVISKAPPLKKTFSKAPRPKVLMSDLPPKLRPVLEEAHALFLANCKLKIELNETPANINTYDLQRKIDDNFNRNRWAWGQIDFYLEKGYLPAVTPGEFTSLNPAQLVKRQLYKASQISKAKAYISKNLAALKSSPLELKARQRIQARITAKKEQLLTLEGQALELIKLIDGD